MLTKAELLSIGGAEAREYFATRFNAPSPVGTAGRVLKDFVPPFIRAAAAAKRAAEPDDDDSDFQAWEEQRRLRALHGQPRPPAPQAPKRTATETVEAWIAASAAEGVARSAAIRDLQRQDPETVRRWVAEVNTAAGRGRR